jgi:hypothetical protein
VDAEAARLATERRQAEPRAARAAKERQRAEKRARSQAAARVEAEERAAQPARPDRRPWAGVAVVIALALVAGFWPGVFSPEKEPIIEPKAASMVVPKAKPKAEPESSDLPFRLKFDQDVDAFAARVKDKE